MVNKKNNVSLTVSRNEAKEQIEKRMEAGSELLSAQITNKTQLTEESEKYSTWNDYNMELLTRLFTSGDISEEYTGLATGLWVGQRSLSQDIEDLKGDIRSKIRNLSSIVERLELIPEEVNVKNENEPIRMASPGYKRKEEMEVQSKASIKAAWILAIGGIIGVAIGVFLTWFLSSSQESPVPVQQTSWLGEWTYEQNTIAGPSTGILTISPLSGDSSKELVGICSDSQTGHSELRGRLIHGGRTFSGTWKRDNRQEGTFEFYLVGHGAIFKGNYSVSPKTELKSANWWDGRRRS